MPKFGVETSASFSITDKQSPWKTTAQSLKRNWQCCRNFFTGGVARDENSVKCNGAISVPITGSWWNLFFFTYIITNHGGTILSTMLPFKLSLYWQLIAHFKFKEYTRVKFYNIWNQNSVLHVRIERRTEYHVMIVPGKQLGGMQVKSTRTRLEQNVENISWKWHHCQHINPVFVVYFAATDLTRQQW